MGITESWSPELPGLLSHSTTMANCVLILLLAFSAQALAEDVQPLAEDVTLADDFEAMILSAREDLQIDTPILRQDTPTAPGEYKLAINDTGSITSPGFPADYQPNEYAKWIFRCIGGFMNFSCFTRIRTSPGCKKDHITFCQKKGFNACTRYCGRNDKLIISSPNRAKIVFKTNDSIKNKGFNCAYTCSATPA